jgi:hypothetical protein
MTNTSYQYPSFTKDEFLEPSAIPKPTTTSDDELRHNHIAMVRDRPFPGVKNEETHYHLQVFEELCSCLVILGMTQEALM